MEVNKMTRIRPNEAGFTLIEMAMSVVVLSVLTFGIAELTRVLVNDVRRMSVWSTRSDIASSIRTAARRFEAFQNSQVHEPSLGPCLTFSISGSFCQSKDADGKLLRNPFTLVSAQSADEILAGPAVVSGNHVPVYYDRSGNRCADLNSGAEQCPLQAIVSYTATCLNGAKLCRGAETVEVDYLIKYRDDYRPEVNDPFRPIDGKVLFQPRNANVRISSAATLDRNYLSDFDWVSGKALGVDPITPVYVSFSMKSEKPIETIEIRSFDLPNGCTFESSDSGPCARPELSAYTLRRSVAVADPTVVSRHTVGFLSYATRNTEVVILGKSAGSYLVGSSIPLYLHGFPPPAVDITGPSLVSIDCSVAGPTFQFTASSTRGLESAQSYIVPPLPSHPDGRLPDFNFDLQNSEPQSYILPSSEVVPGTSYTLHFRVTSNDGVIREATWDFSVDAIDPETIIFNTPAVNAFVRATDNLMVDTTVYLKCGKSMTSSTLSTDQNGTPWMAPTPLSCSSTSSTKSGLLAFNCTGSFACSQWLGRSDCADPAIVTGSNVTLTADVSASGGSGDTNLKQTRDVQVGARINLSFDQQSTVFMLERGYTETSHIPFVITSSIVLPYDVPLVLTYSSGESDVNFTCRAGSSTCRIDGPLPPSDATVGLGLQPDADPIFRVVDPRVATITFDDWLSDCSKQDHEVICPTGQTRKMKIYRWSDYPHDLLFSPLDKDKLKAEGLPEGSNIDALASIRRIDPNASSEKFGIQYWVRHYDSFGTWIATTKSRVYEQFSGPTVQFFKIPDSVWQEHAAQGYFSYSDVEFDIDSNTGIDTIFIRQCYCD